MDATELTTRLADKALSLVRIPSSTGNETQITDHLEQWAKQHVALPKDEVLRHGNCLLLGEPDGKRPCVALLGHVDTVPPAATSPGPAIRGDRLVGRGASDMKSGLAVMQALAEDLDPSNLPFNVLFVFYDREEGPFEHSGLAGLLDTYEMLQSIDFGILMEPTSNTLHLGCLGSLHAQVVFRGKASHSARPWEGENAIHMAGPLLTKLHRLPIREVELEGLTFRESMSITLARGGLARNVVPDSCELNLNYRFAIKDKGDDPAESVTRLVRQLAPDALVEIRDIAPAGPVPRDNPILDHIRQVASLPEHPKEAWTDVGRLAHYGIEAVNFGPGDPAQAHQTQESVALDSMTRSYETLQRVLTQPMPTW